MSETIEAPVTEVTPDLATDTAPSMPNAGEQGEQVSSEDGEQSSGQPAAQEEKSLFPHGCSARLTK